MSAVSTPPKKVLGIDPGSHHLGLGFVEREGMGFRLIAADTLHAPHGDLYVRLRALYAGLKAFLREHRPDEAALEEIFFARNPKSAITLGMARGVAIAACLDLDIPIHEYAPTRIKAAVTGYGRADKAQVKKMVEHIVGVRLALGFDATDALAVAICHAQTARWKDGLSC